MASKTAKGKVKQREVVSSSDDDDSSDEEEDSSDGSEEDSTEGEESGADETGEKDTGETSETDNSNTSNEESDGDTETSTKGSTSHDDSDGGSDDNNSDSEEEGSGITNSDSDSCPGQLSSGESDEEIRGSDQSAGESSGDEACQARQRISVTNPTRKGTPELERLMREVSMISTFSDVDDDKLNGELTIQYSAIEREMEMFTEWKKKFSAKKESLIKRSQKLNDAKRSRIKHLEKELVVARNPSTFSAEEFTNNDKES